MKAVMKYYLARRCRKNSASESFVMFLVAPCSASFAIRTKRSTDFPAFSVCRDFRSSVASIFEIPCFKVLQN